MAIANQHAPRIMHASSWLINQNKLCFINYVLFWNDILIHLWFNHVTILHIICLTNQVKIWYADFDLAIIFVGIEASAVETIETWVCLYTTWLGNEDWRVWWNISSHRTSLTWSCQSRHLHENVRICSAALICVPFNITLRKSLNESKSMLNIGMEGEILILFLTYS